MIINNDFIKEIKDAKDQIIEILIKLEKENNISIDNFTIYNKIISEKDDGTPIIVKDFMVNIEDK